MMVMYQELLYDGDVSRFIISWIYIKISYMMMYQDLLYDGYIS